MGCDAKKAGAAVNRTLLSSNFGNNQLRHVVRIESNPCDEGDFRALAMLMQDVWTQWPDLTRHACPCPTSGRFFYEDGKWVLESTNLVARPTEE